MDDQSKVDENAEKQAVTQEKSDSEAETLILSQKATPVKPKMKPKTASPEGEEVTSGQHGSHSREPKGNRRASRTVGEAASEEERRPTRRSDKPRRQRHSSNDSANSSDEEGTASSGNASDVVAPQRPRRRRLGKISPHSAHSAHSAPSAIDTDALNTGHPPSLSEPSSSLRNQLSPRLRSSHRRIPSSTLSSSLQDQDPSAEMSSAGRRFTSTDREARNASTPRPSGASKQTDRSGQNALHKAAKKNDLPKVISLLDTPPQGMDINQRDNAGNTPLQMASLDGHIEVVKRLLEAGCDPNTTNLDGESPLKDATDEKHTEVIAVLIEHGALMHPELPDNAKAAKNAGPQHVGHFLPQNTASLLKMITAGVTKEVHFLLESRVQADLECLHAAANSDDDELAGLVLAYGCKPVLLTSVADDGRTPLQAAIDTGNEKVVKLLLDAGADPAVKVANSGLTHALYCLRTKSRNYQKITHVLNAHFKTISARDTSGDHNDHTTEGIQAPPEALASEGNPATTDATSGADDAAAPTELDPSLLPSAVRHYLGTGMPVQVPPGSIDYSISTLNRMYARKDAAGTYWTPSFYPAMMAGISLEAVKAAAPGPTPPMTLQHRIDMFKHRPNLAEQLAITKHYGRETNPDRPIATADGISFKRSGPFTSFDMRPQRQAAKQAVLSMRDGVLAWVRKEDLATIVGEEKAAVAVVVAHQGAALLEGEGF